MRTTRGKLPVYAVDEELLSVCAKKCHESTGPRGFGPGADKSVRECPKGARAVRLEFSTKTSGPLFFNLPKSFACQRREDTRQKIEAADKEGGYRRGPQGRVP